MPNEQPEDEFSSEIRAAFEAYSAPRPSNGFDARFWAQLEARQSRYCGFGGFLRRVWEIEIEGVAVWRLALSTLSGGASCALLFALTIGFSSSQSVTQAPVPRPEMPETPRLAFDAHSFYAREWEEFGFQTRPKIAPQTRKATTVEGEFSCVGSKIGWA